MATKTKVDDGKRQINPRSLENLKLGAQARKQDKVRRNTTLLPETIEWLDASGNASNMIDVLVASAKNGTLKFNSDNAHEWNPLSISNDAHEKIADIEDRLNRCQCDRHTLETQNQRLLADLAATQQEIERLQSQQRRSTSPKAIALLQNALALKANAGGAIKEQIKKALMLLADREKLA